MLLISTENRNLTDDEEIEKALRFGEYIKNGELEVLWNSLLQLIKTCQKPLPCTRSASIDTWSACILQTLRLILDRSLSPLGVGRIHSWQQMLEEESGKINCRAWSLLRWQLHESSLSAIVSLQQLYGWLNHAILTYPLDLLREECLDGAHYWPRFEIVHI